MFRAFPSLPAFLLLFALGWPGRIDAAAGNRLAYLETDDPFHVGVDFPKLTTPQWVGEKGVEAVVILAVDDMRDSKRYEDFLRPILERLKKIDGRAPVSIMTVNVPPEDPRFQEWLKEGVSLEVHTLTHPCPLLQRTNFAAAAGVYHGGVDLLNAIPGNVPVAFRMPCCDSMNSPSPRFYSEIFNQRSPGGKFLSIDSSVMNIPTRADAGLPAELVTDAGGGEKFRKYLPSKTNEITTVSMGSFVTTIENYPYPYVIGKLCWEFPCVVPSDWEAQNVHRTNNPITVADWKAALDIAVLKQGTFNLIFHPHGWIRNDQIVELIDYAAQRYGKKVKFLTFREAEERLRRHLLLGQGLRDASGEDNGVRLLDLNHDGFIDVVIGNGRQPVSRIWNPKENAWQDVPFPAWAVGTDDGGRHWETGLKFAVFRPDQFVTAWINSSGMAGKFGDGRTNAPAMSGAWSFDGRQWVQEPALLNGLQLNGEKILSRKANRDQGVRFIDLDHDGRCELIVSNPRQNAIFTVAESGWTKLPYAMPEGVHLVDAEGMDDGVRFVDINGDGYADLIHSNERGYGLYLYLAVPRPNLGWERGWSYKIKSGPRSDSDALPMIVRGGTNRNNGAWFHSGGLWVQNEETATLPDKVDRRALGDLLSAGEPSDTLAEEALRSFDLHPGFKIEVAASEPLIVDPVAFDWGADGKLWVVEMNDYPSGNGGKGGRVKVLEDTDGDGRYDKATVFLDGLNFPNGIMPWRKGVLVSAAPQILYAEDTDGDGKADVRRVLMEGFREGNQQHRINGFEFGLDNWVYAANGDSGGDIRVVSTVSGQSKSGPAVNIRGHDIRFRPDTGELELVAGQTQFGRHHDDWGQWFGNNNPNWLWHYVIPEQYLARNPDLPIRSNRKMLATYPESTRIFAISHPQQRFNWPDAIRQVTSANSATPYRDPLFGGEFTNSVFVSEPANNVVHREVLLPDADGISFTSRRGSDEKNREFLASRDNWFRPTMLKTGPDGALYVADMHRLVIEHPEYFPDELKTRRDLRAGDDKGRIYRIYPENARLRPIPKLNSLSVTGLVAALESSNGWERDTAQRLLVERAEVSATPELKRLFQRSRNPKARLHALAALQGLNAASPEILLLALNDRHPRVREFAVANAEPFLTKPVLPARARVFSQLWDAVEHDGNDPVMAVRRQVAFSLGTSREKRAAQILARIAVKDFDSEPMRVAILASAPGHVAGIFEAFSSTNITVKSPELVGEMLNLAAAADDYLALTNGLNGTFSRYFTNQIPAQIRVLAALAGGLERRNRSLRQWIEASRPQLGTALQRVEPLLPQARTIALESARPERDRVAAIALLGTGPGGELKEMETLAELLAPEIPADVQHAALQKIKSVGDAGLADQLIARWRGYLPARRLEILSLLFSRAPLLDRLLSAIESGRVMPTEIPIAFRDRLLRHGDSAIRTRGTALFAKANPDREKLVKEYENSAIATGDAKKGGPLYRQHCAICHRFGNEGNLVGPDLGTIADKPPSEILVAILDPNRAVDPAWLAYLVETKSGRELTGVIAAESANGITLRTATGLEEAISRSDLKTMRSSGLSLMPEGFESALKPADIADLIAFLKSR